LRGIIGNSYNLTFETTLVGRYQNPTRRPLTVEWIIEKKMADENEKVKMYGKNAGVREN